MGIDNQASAAQDMNTADIRGALDARGGIDIGITNHKAGGNTDRSVSDRRGHLADRLVVRETAMTGRRNKQGAGVEPASLAGDLNSIKQQLDFHEIRKIIQIGNYVIIIPTNDDFSSPLQ